ncbi:hypothetical protein ACWF50_23890 [Brucella pseudogrignonensis]
MRQTGLVVGQITAFYHPIRSQKPHHSILLQLKPMTSNTIDLVQAVSRCAQAAWKRDGGGAGMAIQKRASSLTIS